MQFNGMNPGNLERHTKQSLNSSKTETLLIMTTINPSFLNRLIRIISQSKKHGERGGLAVTDVIMAEMRFCIKIVRCEY